ncbi:MAG: hypothetical protein ACLSCW_01490 [Gemmiger formicilis]|uniref:hypothetical protein n=1 Tax=Gemmiger formicilis TaxID=745368 RepID=UPI0032C123C0
MKKRLVSIILTVFLVLSMVPFAAFADNAIVCPACGGEVIKKPYHLVGNYWDFYKCNTCGKWAYLSGVAGLKLLSAGDQAIINAADANAILNFSFNNGHLIPAEKAPSGIGRKDLPGYNDDNGTPTIGADGFPTLTFKMLLNGFSTSFGGTFLYGSPIGSYSNGTYSVSSIYNFTGFYATDNATNYPSGCVSYYFDAPYTGYYQVTDAPCSVEILSKNYYDNTFSDDNYAGMVQMSYDFTYSKPSLPSRFYDSMKNGESGNFKSGKVYIVKGQRYFFNFYLETYYQLSNSSSSFPSYYSVSIDFPAPTITVTDIGSIATINKQTNITINNNTWNGNIYTDNSTNLTYIYPQYTTINEKNETVTNISTNPIIYNNETKQYYTYDSVTNNYYYITYETTPTPTPSPSPAPAPTWTPGGGATRGGGVGRHPSDTDAADWTLHYYVLNNRRYDAYYALKKTEVDTDTKLPWVDNKKYISTTQIPIANGQYTVSVPDGVYWRVWSWDEASQTLTGVNSSNWHSTINNFLFNATGEYIFEFCKADGSDFNTAKDVTLKLKNDKITDYEDGGTIVEEPTPSPSPEPTETPSPTEPPIPTATPTPGGGTVPTPGGDSGGGNSGSSDSGWNPFKWLTDFLKDIVETILKGLWKLLTSIFGFILWLLSLLFKLFPWMPNSGILALCAGVVVVTVIRIIKFITGR